MFRLSLVLKAARDGEFFFMSSDRDFKESIKIDTGK